MKKGFTLLEITMALTIFAIGIMSILSLFPQGLKSVKMALFDFNALVLAENVLKEEVENVDFKTLDSSQSYEKKIDIYNKAFPVTTQGNEIIPSDVSEGIYICEIEKNTLKDGAEIKFFDFSCNVKVKDIISKNFGKSTLAQVDVVVSDIQSSKQLKLSSFVARNKD